MSIPAHVLLLSKAWAQGGCNACASILSVPRNVASRQVSNLRRQYPEHFPRRRQGRTVRKQAAIRQALALLEQHPEPWAKLASDLLRPLLTPKEP